MILDSPKDRPARDDKPLRDIGVMIVDSDDGVPLAGQLASAGATVQVTPGIGAALERVDQEGPYDVLVTDWKLFDGDGIRELALTSRLAFARTGRVVLTRSRIAGSLAMDLQERGVVMLTKPVASADLIRAVTFAARRPERPSRLLGTLDVAGVRVDPATTRVEVDGRRINVQPLAFRVLVYLMQNAGRSVSQQELLREVWEASYTGETSVVRNQIRSLRSALGRGTTFVRTSPNGDGWEVPSSVD